MRHILKTLLFSVFIIPSFALAQESIEFELIFGSYLNDYYKKEFHIKERKWELKDGVLNYYIDAYDTRYADTITLSNTDVQTIYDFIEANKLNQSFEKDLNKDYLNKGEWDIIIKGTLWFNNEVFEFKFQTNGSSILDEDKDAQHYQKLEQLLFEVTKHYEE